MFKKTLSVILAIAMLCTLVPFAAIAEEATAELTTASEEMSATLAASTKLSNFATSALSSVISNTTVQLPTTIANYKFSADDFKSFTADATAVEQVKASNTYVLIDSNTETTNFVAGENSGNINRKEAHPWISGAGSISSNSGATSAKRVATIYVPETKQYQLMYQRFGYADSGTKTGTNGRLDYSGLTSWNVGNNTHHYFRVTIDDTPLSYTSGLSGTSYESMSELFKGKALHEAGLFDASSVTALTGCTWIEWGPTFTLSKGYHTIQLDLMLGTAMPGVIITDLVGFDWSKIFPLPAYGVAPNNSDFLSATQAGMTAIQRIDTIAPSMSGDVAQTDERAETTATITLPGINESRAVYLVEFTDESLGFESQIIPATQQTLTFEGLQKQTTYQIKVTPMDYLCQKGTAQTLSIMTQYPNIPFFTDGEIVNATDINDASADTKIDVSWTAAQFFGNGSYAYNVYLNNVLKAENVQTNSYSFTGLTEATEYDVKVIATLDGTECEEDISVLEASFYTTKDPTATLVSTTDTTATIKVTGAFSPAEDYEFSNPAVISGTATVEGDVITVSGLTPATKYNLSVSFNESKKGTVNARTNIVSVEFSTMNAMPDAPAPEAIYPTYLKEKGVFVQHDFTTAGDQQTQEQKDAVAASEAQNKWTAFTADGANTSALWYNSQYWYGGNNKTVQVPLYFPATGDYYVFAHGSDNGSAGRGINVSVDGTTVKKSGSDYLFGTTGTSYCDDVVNVTKGNHTITLTNIGGYRLDMVVFVPKSEVDDAGTIADFVAMNLSSAETFNEFATRYKVEKVFLGDGSGVSVTETSPRVLEVSFFPTAYVNELSNLTYKVYLNDALVATLDDDARSYTINSGVVDGKNTIKVEAVVGETVNSSDSVEFKLNAITASATVSTDANDIISSGTISLQAPAYMTGTKSVHVLVVAYKNNRMEKISFATKTLSAGGTDSVVFTVSGDPAKLVDANVANDPTVRSVKLYVLDENFLPIEISY